MGAASGFGRNLSRWVIAAGLAVAVAMGTATAAPPAHAPLGAYGPEDRGHWAFVPRARPAEPTFDQATDRGWVRNPIDAFVLARLRAEGLAPSAPADRATLIRRVTFDLTGLPPTPAEIDAFVRDRSPRAYEDLIDRLLASPHHGERWAQHWLDLVRFAETDGFEYDTHRPEAWRYRDYVVRSLNQDKPYDRFVLEQVAGDEVAAGPGQDDPFVAAGFNRLGPLRKNAGNQEVAASRNEVLTEMTNAVGAAFLGLTLGCARCHSHKFDPISQADYYRIQAYFSATYDKEVARFTEEQERAWKEKASPIQAELKLMRAALKNGPDDQKPALEKKIRDLEDLMPPALPGIHSVTDDPPQRTAIHVLRRGEWSKKDAWVGMRPLGVLLPDGAPELPSDTGRPRTALARWIADGGNPLTARVMANRLWQHHFGRGLVATPNDFGKNGARPTHPGLLDWLANELVARGWSLKAMHRLILTSSTYRQASAAADGAAATAAAARDPDNTLLWRMNRRRLSGEEIRDAMLAASGTLDRKMGGPGVMLPVERELVDALYKPSQWKPADPAEHRRRSIYLIAKRNLRLPFTQVFDAPDLQVSCPQRESSTHAPQALELMNGTISNQQARALAARLRREAGRDPRRQVALAYRLVAGRPPTARERALAVDFLRTQPLQEFALAAFNLDAFLYVD